MTMHAYSELYLDDAQTTLGEMCDFAVYDREMHPDEVALSFAFSGIGREFGRGNPKYVAGMSGPELFRAVKLATSGEEISPVWKEFPSLDRSDAYWAGWSLAYYQWLRGRSFASLYESGLTLTRVMDMYLYHEADITVFVRAADEIVKPDHRESALKRLRAYARLSQSQLAAASGVSLRMIQLYE